MTTRPPLFGSRVRRIRRWRQLTGLAVAAALLLVIGGVGLARRHGLARAQPAPPITLVHAPPGAQVPECLLDAAGVLHLTYGRDGNGYYVQSRDGGATFRPPVRLNRRAGSVAVGGERSPKLAWGEGKVLHSVWLAQADGRMSVRYTRSLDRGRSFEPERELLDAKTHCDSATVAADADGNVWVFWLDGRLPTDPRSPLASPIFMTRSRDRGRTFSPNEPVNHDHPGLACACCRLDARVSAEGYLYLSFRSGYQNVRDAYLLKGRKLENQFRSIRVSADDWRFHG